MSELSDTVFVETHPQQYPYRMLHLPTCPNAKRALYTEDVPFEKAADDKSRNYHGDWHDRCIKPEGPLWTALLVRARQIREARRAAEQRWNLLIDLAVAKVAVAKLTAEAGPLTDEETARMAEYDRQIPAGTFRPHSVRDLRDVAIAKSSFDL